MTTYHTPVLLQAAIEGLAIKPNGVYVDATFGGGGHAKAILEQLDNGKLIAFDQDPDALENKNEIEIDDERLLLVPQNFRYLKKYLQLYQSPQVDGILGDLGISSHQIDTPERGFSTRFDGPLDMRMNPTATISAKDILNNYLEEELVKLFSQYGEIRNAKTLARTICEARNEQLLETADQLKHLVDPIAKGNRNRYYAQLFQALRIVVNDELEALKEFLEQSVEVLKPKGHLVVISYHSLEDRLVKNVMRYGNAAGKADKDFFGNLLTPMEPITKKPITPSPAEIKQNPRARSAKMRIACKKETTTP